MPTRETLAKQGFASRAEITDAAMGKRAERVLFNKGPHIHQALRVLDDILQREQSHHSKKPLCFDLAGSPVNLVISSGPETVVVPNVEGLTQAAATAAITAAKLTVGTVTQQTSDTLAPGKVISQDPASGGSVVQGAPINLVISSE